MIYHYDFHLLYIRVKLDYYSLVISLITELIYPYIDAGLIWYVQGVWQLETVPTSQLYEGTEPRDITSFYSFGIENVE